MSISELNHVSKVEEPIRRLEIFTGAGRRRSWSADEKAAIVAESYASADSVCAVARRHGLTPQQLFTWRRQARGALDTPAPSLFVQAVVEPELPAPDLAKPQRRLGSRAVDSGLIEVEIDGVVVRVGRGAEAKTVAAVLKALRVPS